MPEGTEVKAKAFDSTLTKNNYILQPEDGSQLFIMFAEILNMSLPERPEKILEFDLPESMLCLDIAYDSGSTQSKVYCRSIALEVTHYIISSSSPWAAEVTDYSIITLTINDADTAGIFSRPAQQNLVWFVATASLSDNFYTYDAKKAKLLAISEDFSSDNCINGEQTSNSETRNILQSFDWTMTEQEDLTFTELPFNYDLSPEPTLYDIEFESSPPTCREFLEAVEQENVKLTGPF